MRTKTSKAAKIRKALEAGQSPKEIARSVKVPVQSVYTEKWKMSKDKPAVKAKVMARRKKVILKVANKVFDKEYKKFVTKNTELTQVQILREELAGVQQQITKYQIIEQFLSDRIHYYNATEKWAMVEEQNA